MFYLSILLIGSQALEPVLNAEDNDKPWDFFPYRVTVWVVGPKLQPYADVVRSELLGFLERDFSSIWTTEVVDAPAVVRGAAARQLEKVDYGMLIAKDPVVAIKRNHVKAARIRTLRDVEKHIAKCYANQATVEDVKHRCEASDVPVDDVLAILKIAESRKGSVASLWADPLTEALLLPRGLAAGLRDPAPKLMSLKLSGLQMTTLDQRDKVFVLKINEMGVRCDVEVVEFDCLLRLRGPVVRAVGLRSDWTEIIGNAILRAFAPTVRIEQAGTKKIMGRVRAGGLILDPISPAAIGVGDFLQPAIRKDDRYGNPILAQNLDWAYLHVQKTIGPAVEMKLYAGRSGGLRGRRNKRTHRVALRIRPYYSDTVIRLQAWRKVNEPLRGYEFYEKDLETGAMSFVGRTDWDGRFTVLKTDQPLRLLYVKNGGSILARLPTVPGQSSFAVAELSGDDIRLEAEAFIRGIQNEIIDLVGMRKLYAHRIRLRLEKGKLEEARDMLDILRNLETRQSLGETMNRKEKVYDGVKGNQRAMINQMFSQTREMLNKHINDRIIAELESEVAQATVPAETQSPSKKAKVLDSDTKGSEPEKIKAEALEE